MAGTKLNSQGQDQKGHAQSQAPSIRSPNHAQNTGSNEMDSNQSKNYGSRSSEDKDISQNQISKGN